MNRRFLLRFLGLAPLGGVAAIVTAGTAPAATTWGAGIPGYLRAWKPPQPFTPAMRAEFQRQFIDPVLSGEAELLESRRFEIEEICKFMGVPPREARL